MFKLFKKLFTDERYPSLPEPTRPAPPMPECKPTKEQPKEDDISEPVITLLEELKKDVWEVKRHYSGNRTTFFVIHIYKESVRFSCYCTSYRFENESIKVTTVDWMTEREKQKVERSLKVLIDGQLEVQAQLEKINSREEFSKALLGK